MKKITIELTNEQYAALVLLNGLSDSDTDEEIRSKIFVDIADDIIEKCAEKAYMIYSKHR